MNMLNELTCRVAKTKVVETDNGDVLLVERFDLVDASAYYHA